MVKVEMPRASWNSVVMILEIAKRDGWLVDDLLEDINKQLDGQEY